MANCEGPAVRASKSSPRKWQENWADSQAEKSGVKSSWRKWSENQVKVKKITNFKEQVIWTH